LLAALVLLLAAAVPHPARALERLEPPTGCYLGFNLGAGDSIEGLSARLGLVPAVFVQFYGFPLSASQRTNVVNFLNEVFHLGGIPLLSLEPFDGLAAVTPSVVADLAELCYSFETQGISGIMIRFAHEMNGNWYPWGQQPLLFKEKFRLVSQQVRARTTRTALLWAPNQGVGYPYSPTGPYRAQPGTPDFAALDTNGDGVLTDADDMYEPFYPGDDVVDWVGMTIYHWGLSYPWLENELPPPLAFARALTDNGGTLPNFYARYCGGGLHAKPLAIPETSAFYNTQQPGPEDLAIKQGWWQQTFNLGGDTSQAWDIPTHFPRLKCINWFDHLKPETEAQSQWIDWRVSADPLLRGAFLDYVRTPRGGQAYFLTAPEAQALWNPYAIMPTNLPLILPLTGSLRVGFRTKAASACDLVVDLLDENFQWKGGTRVPVATGTQAVATTFNLAAPLTDGERYRWSVFLTPRGSNYLSALAWLRWPFPVARAVTPAVQIVAAPPVWIAGSGLSVRVKHSIATNAVLHVQVLDASANFRTNRTLALKRYDGIVEVVFPPPNGLPNGDYQLEALLSDSTSNRQNPFARSARLPVRLESAPGSDALRALAEPTSMPTGEVVRVLVGYAARANRNLHAALLDEQGVSLDQVIQNVGPGSAAREFTLHAPQTTPGTYFIRTRLADPGQPGEPAVALAPDLAVFMFADDYRDWAESIWGAILSFDPVGPTQDPDRDLATNEQECGALTDPRNAASVLRARFRRSGNQFILSWPSVVGRKYQVFKSADLVDRSWTPLGGAKAGTGGVIEVSVNRESSRASLYRVAASPP
jgi:hypothetical protein